MDTRCDGRARDWQAARELTPAEMGPPEPRLEVAAVPAAELAGDDGPTVVVWHGPGLLPALRSVLGIPVSGAGHE
jgi:hypothetical protein